MEAADAVGIQIPRLCYHPHLSILGACRVCLVEVEGQRNPVASCAYPVAEGMKVRTSSTAAAPPAARRRGADPRQPPAGLPDLRAQRQLRAAEPGLRAGRPRAPVRRASASASPKDLSSPAVIRDPEKCILCGRCVRVCAEVQGVYNLSQQRRGFHIVVAPAHEGDMMDSVCIHCGQCVNVCPTAAFVEHNDTEDGVRRAGGSRRSTSWSRPRRRSARPSARASASSPARRRPARWSPRCGCMGFDKVFDTNFGADLTIVEEAHEFVAPPAERTSSCR